jgi:hypothetical protein
LLPLDALAARLKTALDLETPGASRGLDEAVAVARLVTHGRNELPEPPRPSLILLFLKKARANATRSRAAAALLPAVSTAVAPPRAHAHLLRALRPARREFSAAVCLEGASSAGSTAPLRAHACAHLLRALRPARCEFTGCSAEASADFCLLHQFTDVFMVLLMLAGGLSFVAFGIDNTQKSNYIIGIILFGVVVLYCYMTFREGASC